MPITTSFFLQDIKDKTAWIIAVRYGAQLPDEPEKDK
jgi:hypothetical protein